MWKTVAVVVMGIAWLADAPSDLLRQVREAGSSKDAVAAARRLEEALPEGVERWTYLAPLVETLEQRGEVDAAVGALRRSADKVGEKLELYRIERLAQVLLRARRLDAAQEAAEEGLLSLDLEPNELVRRSHESDLHGLLGEVHEAAGRFRAALEHYERWEWTATCGTGMDTFQRQKGVAVARCRFELGEVDDALDSLLALVGDVDGGIGQHAADAAVRFGQLSARAGRSDTARKLAKTIGGAHAVEATRLVEMGIAVEEADAARVLAIASQGLAGTSLPEAGFHARSPVPQAAQRELKAMGASIAAAVERAIVDGDRVATLVATGGNLPGTERGVRRRLERESDPDWRSTLRAWLEFAD